MTTDRYGRRGNMVALRVCKEDGTPTGETRWLFWCPGCDSAHAFTTPRWTRTGADDVPTFAPSLLCTWGPSLADRCHLFLRGGMLEFLNDCTHDLKGQKVALPEPPKWLYEDVAKETDPDA